jgi:glycoside/pentoside/hexuronide:cation symporter, GPH family
MLVYRVLFAVGRPVLTAAFRPQVAGSANVPRTGGIVVCPTHLSGFDVLAVACALAPRTPRNMAKSELFRSPLLRWLIRSLGAFPARDERRVRGGVAAGAALAAAGEAVVIFPEGARRRGRVRRPRKGRGTDSSDRRRPDRAHRAARDGRLAPARTMARVVRRTVAARRPRRARARTGLARGDRSHVGAPAGARSRARRVVTLPRSRQILYGTSRVGSEALGRSQGLWLLYYYAPPSDAHLPTLLPSIVVGVLLTVGGLVGALDDAIVGFVSDRTTSRLGRRIPYILIGAPLWSLFFILLFTPPPDAGNAVIAVYLFFVFEAVSLFTSVVVGPYEALLPELAPTSDERVGLQAIKVYLGVLGTALGLLGSDLLVHHVGFKAMAVSIAAFALVCQYLAIGGVWERARLSNVPARMGFRDALRTTSQNAAFRVLLPTVVLFALAFQLLQTDIPFYVHAVVGKHSWLGSQVLLGVAIAAALVCVPLFARLAERTSKRHAYRVSMIAAAAAFPLLALAGVVPGMPTDAQILVAAVLIGAPIGAHYLFPVPLTADVIDDDSTRTKERREATYLGTSSFVERTATALAPLIVVLLRLLGDTEGHTLGVRLVGPVAGLFVLAAYLIFRTYDMPDEVRGRVRPEAVPE